MQQPRSLTHLRGKGRKGLWCCRRKTVHILSPCLFLKPKKEEEVTTAEIQGTYSFFSRLFGGLEGFKEGKSRVGGGERAHRDANSNSKNTRSFPHREEDFSLLSSLLPQAGEEAGSGWEGGGETRAITPTRCTDRAARTRPQTPGCSYRAPPAGHGLRSPRSGHGFGSERPPGWDLRIPPVRLRLPLTSLGGEDPASPRAGARALLPDAPQVRAPHTERWRRRRELPSERFACPAVSAPGGR